MTRARELANFADDTAGLETLTVSDITDLTATATELNKLDGVTATTSELNVTDGVTVSTANINSAVNQITDSSTDLNVDSNTLVVDKSANSVGIGTTSPDEMLHLQSSTSLKPILKIENTNADHLNAQIHLVKNSASEADDDYLGQIDFKGLNDNDELTAYGRLQARAKDVSDGTEDGRVFIASMKNGTLDETLNIESGKVGIGTTTPESLLTLTAPFYNVSETGGMIRWQNQDTDHASDVCIQGYNVDTHGCEIYIGLNSYISTGGSITKFHSTEEMCGMLLGRTGDYGFYSASASGSASAKLQVDSIGRIYLGAYADASNTSFSTNASANVYIGTGSDSGVIYRSTSSRRFKTNIVDTAKGLNELLTLRPVDFNSLCENDNKDKLRTGFIAEEVDNAGFDEYIQRGPDSEANGIDYAHMVALCVKSIQELSAKVTTLENA